MVTWSHVSLVTIYTAVCSPPIANLVLFLLVLELILEVSLLAGLLMLDLRGPVCKLPANCLNDELFMMIINIGFLTCR